MKKKVLSILLVALLIVGTVPANVFAATTKYERPLTFETNIATELKKLNLFKGVSDTNFALEKVPSRLEALVIMLRLMGKENEILAGSYSHPFTDVPSWADKYVGYAYENGLTKGSSATKFGTGNATDVQFLTFVLRALGYSDSDGDFTWDNPYALAEELGILTCAVTTGSGFLRADCASISYNALAAKLKGVEDTLADKLIDEEVFSKEEYQEIVKNTPDYADLIRTYGLKWHDNPQDKNDHVDNMCYCIATGDFEWTTGSEGNLAIDRIGTIRAEIAGYMMNQSFRCCARNGKYYLAVIDGVESPLSPKEISDQIIECYKIGKEIQTSLYASGKLSANMNDMQKAQVYSDYLQTYGAQVAFKGSFFPDNYAQPWVRILYMQHDTAYGILADKFGNCGGRAAAYNVLMNIEGIRTVGLHVQGHIISYFWIDGQEYFCDWGNRIGIFTYEDVQSGRKPYSNIQWQNDWLETVRTYYHYGANDINMGNSADLAYVSRPGDTSILEWKFEKEDDTHKYYFVKINDTTLPNGKYIIWYGYPESGYTMGRNNLESLKQGVTVRIGKETLSRYQIEENIFIMYIGK